MIIGFIKLNLKLLKLSYLSIIWIIGVSLILLDMCYKLSCLLIGGLLGVILKLVRCGK